MRAEADWSVRRVGFRSGTDEELTALHTVEVPIEVERGSYRMPKSLGAYIAFARNLPTQFSDHSWLVESVDASPIAVGYCWSNSAGEDRVMECDLLVHRDRRREGIALRLMTLICAQAEREGRSLLTWSTYDPVPAAAIFSERVGARVARVNRESDLELSDVDWAMVEQWTSADEARRLGYSLGIVVGAFPADRRADAVTFHHIMQTAPRDDLDIGDVIIDEEFVAELDRALAESGRTRWTVLVRDGNGTCVGGTEITFEPDDPAIVHQQNTGIDPGHRGHGLAKWAKGTMLTRVRDGCPAAYRVRTGNAFSNAPMLAINDALGFKIVATRTEWQAETNEVKRALSRTT